MKTELVNSDSQSLLLNLAARELGSNVGEKCIGNRSDFPASSQPEHPESGAFYSDLATR